MKRLIYILLIFTAAVTGCSEQEIPTFDESYTSVRFPGNLQYTGSETGRFPGYSGDLQMFLTSYSFLSVDLDAQYMEVEVPLVVTGATKSFDRPVNIEPYTGTEDNPLENDDPRYWEILDAIIPADSVYGYVRLRLYRDEDIDRITRQLHLIVRESADFLPGASRYIRARVSWNNSVTMPETANVRRTYNMLINSPLAFTSTSMNYYSPMAHKVILLATGWDELPQFSAIYAVGELYKGYARMVGDYIEAFNTANPSSPLLHDAGDYEGQPIVARSY